MSDFAIDPGALRDRVTLQRRSTARDDYGQGAITWTDVAIVWARVEPLRSGEFFAAAAVQQQTTVKVTIRARTDVDATWRLLWNGQPHDITGVLPIGRTHSQIMAMAGVKDGR